MACWIALYGSQFVLSFFLKKKQTQMTMFYMFRCCCWCIWFGFIIKRFYLCAGLPTMMLVLLLFLWPIQHKVCDCMLHAIIFDIFFLALLKLCTLCSFSPCFFLFYACNKWRNFVQMRLLHAPKWKMETFFSTMQWYGCSLRVARDGYRLRKFSYNLVTRVCFYCVLHLHICIWCCLHVFLCCLCILYSYTIFLGATHAKDIILWIICFRWNRQYESQNH